MNKNNLYIVIALITLIVAGIGVFFLADSKKQTAVDTNAPTTNYSVDGLAKVDFSCKPIRTDDQYYISHGCLDYRKQVEGKGGVLYDLKIFSYKTDDDLKEDYLSKCEDPSLTKDGEPYVTTMAARDVLKISCHRIEQAAGDVESSYMTYFIDRANLKIYSLETMKKELPENTESTASTDHQTFVNSFAITQ